MAIYLAGWLFLLRVPHFKYAAFFALGLAAFLTIDPLLYTPDDPILYRIFRGVWSGLVFFSVAAVLIAFRKWMRAGKAAKERAQAAITDAELNKFREQSERGSA